MAAVSQRDGKWYIKFEDESGRWVRKVCTAESKTEAKRLAVDMERQEERRRHGLEPMRPSDGGGTLAELLRWWLDTYSSQMPTHQRNIYSIEKHFLSAPIARLKFTEVSAGCSRPASRRRGGPTRRRR